MKKHGTQKLVRLARNAAKAHAKAASLNKAWAEAFYEQYGHDDISDALVEVIEYSCGDVSMLTEDYIDANSKPGKS